MPHLISINVTVGGFCFASCHLASIIMLYVYAFAVSAVKGVYPMTDKILITLPQYFTTLYSQWNALMNVGASND